MQALFFFLIKGDMCILCTINMFCHLEWSPGMQQIREFICAYQELRKGLAERKEKNSTASGRIILGIKYQTKFVFNSRVFKIDQ